MKSLPHCSSRSEDFEYTFDSEWSARIADFRIVSATTDTDVSGNMEDDVYNFGIVLLEMLSGRNAYERDCTPPGIVEWALSLIRKGKEKKGSCHFRPERCLKDFAKLSLRRNSCERPGMNNLVTSLDQIVKCELILS
ncbi:hypothetical protein V6N13_012665 [Hibiscus sabdariffa]|uniref:Serine-threonine/tyrosine-protein kinase catalytic domain-containing protein n=1 Tax=Hibiscus sabdariffa TaxID=183260 RepID=A0ABR2SGI3_9ROSI